MLLFNILKQMPMLSTAMAARTRCNWLFFVCVDDALIYVVGRVFLIISTHETRRQIATGQVFCCVCGDF
jgi:hypothetical protein